MSSRADGSDRERLRQIAWTTTFATFFVGVGTYMSWVSSDGFLGLGGVFGEPTQSMHLGLNTAVLTGASTALNLGAVSLPNWTIAASCLAATTMCWVRAAGTGRINPWIPSLLFFSGLIHACLAGVAVLPKQTLGPGLVLAMIATAIASASSARALRVGRESE